MKTYEAVVIFASDESQHQAGREFLRKEFESSGIAIKKEEDMGDRILAYPVRKKDRGHYVLYVIECTGEPLKALSKNLKLRPEILKYLFVRQDNVLTRREGVMADINHVVLVGRLTRNAELKYTNNGSAVSKFSIAINQRRKKDDQWVDEAHFFDIVLWGKTAESLNQYLVKGKQIGVEGQLRQNRWEQEGQARSKVEIFATNVMLLGSGGGGGGGRPASPAAEPKGAGGGDFPEGGTPPADNFEDDIPF